MEGGITDVNKAAGTAEAAGTAQAQAGAGDKAAPAGDKTPTCPPGKSCVVKEAAAWLQSKGDAWEAAGKAITDYPTKKISGFANAVMEDIQKPVKCVADAAEFFPNIIEGIFNAIAGGFEKVGNSAEKMTEKIAGLAMDEDGLPNVFAPFQIIYLMTVKKIQGLIGSLVFGADWEKKLSDPNMKPDKLMDDMLKNSASFQRLVDRPAFKGIFDKWIGNYAEALDKAIELARPKLDKVTNKLTGIVDQTGKKIGESFTGSLVNIIGAALKSIPGVGVIFNVATLAKQLAAKIITVCEPMLTKGGFAVIGAANAGADRIEDLKCRIEDLKKKLGPLLQSGGYNITRKNNDNKKKIMRATKHIKHMLGNRNRNNSNKNKQTKKHRVNYAKRLMINDTAISLNAIML